LDYSTSAKKGYQKEETDNPFGLVNVKRCGV